MDESLQSFSYSDLKNLKKDFEAEFISVRGKLNKKQQDFKILRDLINEELISRRETLFQSHFGYQKY